MGANATTSLHVVARKANGAITHSRVVKLDTTAGQVVAAAAIADVPYGVALNTVADTEMVSIETGYGAEVKVCASAAIAIGDELMVTAAGGGKVSTLAGATARSVGLALSAAAADGDHITMRLGGALKSPVGS